MLSKMNSSTDNISISSTVSSASMMLRKIGTLGGRLGKRGSLGSIGSMFSKDKDRDSDAMSEMGVPGSLGSSSKLKKKDKKKAALAAAHVAHVTIEQEHPPQGSGMTPAAALVHRHQQQEAAAAEAAARAQKEAEQAKEAERSKIDDKRLRGIEKEKEKLKGRKQKKWGMGSLSGSSSLGTASSTTSLDRHQGVGEFGEASSHRDDAGSINEQYFQDNASLMEDRTPRASVDLDTSIQQYERLDLGATAASERLESYFDDDTASFRGGGGSGMNTPRSLHEESGSEYEGSLYRGKQTYHAEPMKSFRPVKGILKG